MAYGTILIDPPWAEHGGGRVKRGADRHYPLLKRADIPRVVWSAPEFDPADDAHLWLWATNNFLSDGLALIRHLGFRYVTNLVWVKMRDNHPFDHMLTGSMEHEAGLQIGLGQYFRGAHELLLFAVRGKAMVPKPCDRLPSVVFAERGKHSEKPRVIYDRIERISPAPRLEMFARSRREGWTSWGNEVS